MENRWRILGMAELLGVLVGRWVEVEQGWKEGEGSVPETDGAHQNMEAEYGSWTTEKCEWLDFGHWEHRQEGECGILNASWATGWRCGFTVYFIYTTSQVICLLMFLNCHVQYVYLRRKGKSSCFESWFITACSLNQPHRTWAAPL